VPALARFVAEYGTDQLKNYVMLARSAGAGLSTAERPYPSDLTVRVEFPTMADAWRAAGVDVPAKSRAPKKAKASKTSRPRSVAFISAEDAAASRELDAHVTAAPIPCPDCATLRSERDELAWALRELVNGNESAIRLVRAGLAIATGGTKR